MSQAHISLHDVIGLTIAGIFLIISIVGFIYICLAERKTRKYENEIVWTCEMEQRENSSQPVIDPYCTKHTEYGIDNDHCAMGELVKRKDYPRH